ncbi:MAG: hypothetical protein WCS85_00160 [Candidatus Peribacteraceae bacterium]|jgi:hydroxymethylglutaryl-CoA reductase (NADPH)
MDLRTLPPDLDAEGRCNERRKRVEKSLGTPLSLLRTNKDVIGHADERNCEQMLGCVSVPVGYAGPLRIQFSSGDETDVHLPLATTEGALVASINRGCKALATCGVHTSSTLHGTTRSLAFHVPKETRPFTSALTEGKRNWQRIAEGTSEHLTLLSFDIDTKGDFVFLTLAFDTDEAMGMNMVTIAAQAAGEWITEKLLPDGGSFVTVAGNVDSDKKPSRRTKERGRGIEVTAEALLDRATIEKVLKTTPEMMLKTAEAKLKYGSVVAGALGENLHAANVIAALYIATGQDPAHVVEGSLADTVVKKSGNGLSITVRLPAILAGVRGGGTSLPSQSQCLKMLLKPKTKLHPKKQLAESIGAAVLAGELSLLAAQASHTLASAHKKLGR